MPDLEDPPVADETTEETTPTQDDATPVVGDTDADQQAAPKADASDDKPAEPSEPRFAADLLSRAKALHLDDAEIEGYDDEKSLDGYVTHLERGLARMLSQRSAPEADAKPAETPPTESSKPVDAKPATPAAPVVQGKPAWLEKDESEYDPDFIEPLKKLDAYLGSQVSAVRTEVQEALGHIVQAFQETMTQQAVQQELEAFDKFLNESGDEYQELLGKGRGVDLKVSNPKAFELRKEILQCAADFRNLYASQGRDVARDTVFSRARDEILKTKQKELARKAAAQEITARRRKFSAPKSNRSFAPPVDSIDAALIAEAEEARREFGADGD